MTKDSIVVVYKLGVIRFKIKWRACSLIAMSAAIFGGRGDKMGLKMNRN